MSRYSPTEKLRFRVRGKPGAVIRRGDLSRFRNGIEYELERSIRLPESEGADEVSMEAPFVPVGETGR